MDNNLNRSLLDQPGAVQTTEVPASNIVNPFEEVQETSPFEGIEAAPSSTQAEGEATPVRTLIAGLALTQVENRPAVDLPENLQIMYDTIAKAEQMLNNGEEQMIQYQAALAKVEEQDRALRGLRADPVVTPELGNMIQETLAANRAIALEEAAKTAMYDQAVNAIQDRLVAGDEVGARLLLNQLDPDKNTTMGVTREMVTKRMILASALERAGIDEENEGWIPWLLSTVISVPEAILAGETFWRLGNTPEGVGGYQPTLMRFFTPGSEMARQIEAVQGLTAAELQEQLPRLIENWRSNSTTLGVFDAGRFTEIVRQYYNSITEEEAIAVNVFANIDAISLVPFGLGARLLSGTRALASLGARNTAARNIAAAIDTATSEGEQLTRRVTGVTIPEVVDNSLPTAINPFRPAANTVTQPLTVEARLRAGTALERGINPALTLPQENMVSLSGEITSLRKAADSALEEMISPYPSARWYNVAEREAQTEAAQRMVRERTREEIADFAINEIDTATGSAVRRISAVLNRAFASMEEAVGFINSRGLRGIASIDDSRKPITRKVTPRDEGFTRPVYHGTNQVFDEIRVSAHGKLGTGVYTTTQPNVASSYAGRIAKDGRGNILTPNVRPYLVNETKIWGMDKLDGWTVEDLNKVFDEMGIDVGNRQKILDFLDPRVKANGKFNGEDVYDSLVAWHSMDNPMDGAEIFAKKLEEKGYHGIAVDFHGDNEIMIFDPKNLRNYFDAQEVVDVSGRIMVKVEMDIPETAFWTNPLQPPRQSIFSRFWKNPSQTSDIRLFEQATEANNRSQNLLKQFEKNFLAEFRKLGRIDREYLKQMLMKMENQGRWWEKAEFDTIYERATGLPPKEKMWEAYRLYVFNNNMEHTIRNDMMYVEKHIRGYSSATFNIQNQPFDHDVIIDWTPVQVPTERVYNLTDDVHYTRDAISSASTGVRRQTELTSDRLKELVAEGYVMFRTEQPLTLPDGTTVRRFLAKRTDIESNNLRRDQLNYRPGGHRLYADKYFVKQAQLGVQPDTGKPFMRNPNVFATAPTLRYAEEFTETMNDAAKAVAAGEDAAYLDRVIFRGQVGYPSGQEFIDEVKAGRILTDTFERGPRQGELKYPFEALFDREVPAAYRENAQIADMFLDEDEVGFNGFYRTTGKMYYSPKGEHLRNWQGDFAPTIDPFEAQSAALNNVIRMSTFQDFKLSSLERWLNTYKSELNIPDDIIDSPVRAFEAATVRYDTPLAVREQIEGQRASIKRILGHETQFDRTYRQFVRNTAEWIAGYDSPLAQKAAEKVFWLQDTNPLGFLRGLAFDMKLGMFNFGQFFIQTSTMASAWALSPSAATKGMFSGAALRAYLLRGDERVLDAVAKKFYKTGGFSDVDEFKEYARFVRSSGFLDVDDTHQLVNNYGPSSTYAISDKIEAVRTMGRFFFNEAEIWNRIVATRIAYDEAIKTLGRRSFDDFDFRQFVQGRAENYSFNMSQTSQAAWQTGVLSVPTQFWAYNVRMIEALTGTNFTAAQKVRLLGMQLALAGTGGIPILSAIMTWRNMEDGRAPDISTVEGVFQRGFADRMIYEFIGADISVGERWGTGSWSTDLIKDIMGWSEYNTQSVSDMAGGATYSIMSTFLGTALASAVETARLWMVHESGHGEQGLNEDQWIALMRQISTFNNVTKAMLVMETGVLRSTTGNRLASNMPEESALFIAMGFRPGSEIDREAMMAFNKNRQESIREISTQINNYLMEGMDRPDLLAENAAKVNTLINLVPLEMRADVLRQVRISRDPSIYDRMLRLRQQRELVEDIAQEVTEEEQNGTSN